MMLTFSYNHYYPFPWATHTLHCMRLSLIIRPGHNCGNGDVISLAQELGNTKNMVWKPTFLTGSSPARHSNLGNTFTFILSFKLHQNVKQYLHPNTCQNCWQGQTQQRWRLVPVSQQDHLSWQLAEGCASNSCIQIFSTNIIHKQ